MRKNMKNATVKTVTITNEALAQSIVDGAVSICGIKVASIPVDLLEVDESYQRDTHDVQELIPFDKKKCGFILVSFRNGKFYIIDGQHRYLAAKFLGIASLPCIILIETQEDEALIFSGQDIGKKKLTPYDTFKANIASGKESVPRVKTDMEINRICSSHGIRIIRATRYTRNDKILRSLAEARRIVNSNGVDCFEWIINTICSTNWDTCPISYTQEILRMLKHYYTNNEVIDNDSVRKAMNSTTPMQILALSKADYPEYSIRVGLNICFKKLVDSYNIKAVKKIKAVS